MKLQSRRKQTREEALLAFLSDPASYSHRPREVRIVQTHASYVAIASPWVYKVKKPVNFGFLDFTTLEKRHHYCEEELALNRRLCASIYEAVVPIYQGFEGLAFEPTTRGEIVEYAVQMHELPTEGFLDQLIAAGEVDEAVLSRISSKLESFYATGRSDARVAEWGRLATIKISTDENFEQTERYCGDELPVPTYEFLRWYTNRFYETHTELFERRVADGRILDCHGDLRAEHIHVTEAEVCIYDCIEFNERFRYIDVANDVAFLAMDLRHLGRTDLSRMIVSTIAHDLGDADLLSLLPFYACYRAYVRGKVELMRGAEAEVPAAERTLSRDRARSYFRLAADYALTGGHPAVLIFMGRVGTGKSTTARTVAELLGWRVESSDRLRKEMHGLPLYERASETTPDIYSGSVTDAVYSKLAAAALANAAEHRGTILDATYSRERHRVSLTQQLEAAGVPYVFVQTTAGSDTVLSRLRQRDGRGDIVSDARAEDVEALNSVFQPLGDEEVPVVSVATDGTLDESVFVLLKEVVGLLSPGG